MAKSTPSATDSEGDPPVQLLPIPPRVCGHSPEGQECADEIDCGFEAAISLVVAGGNAAELLDRAKEILDQVAPAIHGEIAGDFGGAICLWGNDRHGTPAVQFDADPIYIESLVGKQGTEDNTLDQRGDAYAVMALPR